VEETGSGRGPEDTLFGTRRTDGQGLNPLLARMAQANALRQAHGLRVSVDEGERQGADLYISILRRSLTTCGESCERDHPRWASGGLHNLRQSLSNWLVNKAKENPKTVQGILGHSRIQTTLDLYTDEDLDEMIAAQEKFIDAVGFERETVQ
jgi:integrase